MVFLKTMDVFTAIKKRRSIRKYQDREIPEPILNKILEAGRLAPSASNLQEYKIIVVRDSDTKEKLATASLNQKFLAEASAILVGVSLNPSHIMKSGTPAWAVDIAIAFDHITLIAVEEGLGTCWIGAFEEEKVKEILNIPEEYKVVVLLTLGFPAESPEMRPRKELKEIVCYEKFSK